jgi:CRP-like cAMP-binding protein
MISPEVLRRYPYFSGVNEESLKRVAMICSEKSVRGGATLFREGDPADFLAILVKGEINIQCELGTGELRTVDTLVDGDLLCWSALIEPYKLTAIGSAVKDCDLVTIDAVRLRQLCDSDAQLGYMLIKQVAKSLAHRLEGARVQLAAA